MKNNKEIVKDKIILKNRKLINCRKIRRIVAFCIATVMIFLTAPELFVHAAEETWKTVTDPNSVGSSIYAYGDEFLVAKDGKMSLLDENMDVICTYDSIAYYYEGYYKVTDGGNVFIINTNNQIVIPAGYDSISYYSGVGNYIVVGKDNKYGLINFNNETVLACSYDSIYTNQNTPATGIVMVKNDGKFGLVNINSGIVGEIEYSSMNLYSDTSKGTVCYIGAKDGFTCVFDSMGNQTIPLGEYSNIKYSSSGMLITVKNSQYGLSEVDGTVILEPKYSSIIIYGNNIINYTVQDTQGVSTKYYMDRTGKLLDIPINSSLSTGSDGYYKLTKTDGTKYYITINEDGTINNFGDGTYNDINYIANGYFCLTKGTEKAVMDVSGNIVIPYQSTYSFSNSLSNDFFVIYKTIISTVTNSTTGTTSTTTSTFYGIMNKSGKIVIPTIYFSLYRNSSTGIITGILNKSMPSISFLLTDITFISENYDTALKIEETGGFKVLKDGKFGVINSSLDVIIPLEYDMIIYVGDNNFKVLKNGKYGVINSNGTIVKPCIYNNVFIFNSSLNSISSLNMYDHNITANTTILYKSQSVKDDTFRISNSSLYFSSIKSTKQLSITTETLNTSGLVWSSDNEGVAIVSSTGLVTSIAPGTAKITATLGSLTATSDVTVNSLKIGDVTQDNTIDIFDILAIQRHILGITALTGSSLTAADVTADNIIDIFDILAIQRQILGI